MTRKRRKGRPASEYFIAFVGIALIVFVVAVIASPGSCKVRVSPEIGVQPSAPRPTPTPTP
ncbi:MAG TPA: hypothetical protein VMT19_01010 [Thermoanaerobaculaceae bacterium]|nr:hypothetical protein [Thermoanaerobaculaceae bacterium]